MYIVGGAMMALAHDAKRVTKDVDSHIRRGRDAVTRAVAATAVVDGQLAEREPGRPRPLPQRGLAICKGIVEAW